MKAHGSFYDILGVSDDSDLIAIKEAYKRKLLAYHPDKKPLHHHMEDKTIVNRIQEAYAVLSNQRTRAEYNEGLTQQSKRAGVVSDGEGLDMFDLDDFKMVQEEPPMDDYSNSYSRIYWEKDCPRCSTEQGFILTETALSEQGTKVTETGESGRYEVLAQCNSCSLWLKIIYYDLDEVDDTFLHG
ncbi:Diphthamide biosynthesis protein 4 [Komagataella phaffii CBS 7435]|uniref:Diphthamide biosynthesis protein 4 n=2 Tax=Komagataella phaffii TaxID=460519 RepID=C4R1T8_KOMPG|nr:uncharacterized protein PAS_chr2-1_0803 [Komagataella phaffii GS115]AOA62087.1 GQ67_00878T0 [Komagataella phaffii]CAH2447999.1 Diphthamide biosynthesis protein 4 [Komagataella phaffii CBS 7435]AOA67790.1 GQ68_00511T0 [Komagataella phaffii GS115]CAY69462.1 Protein of unknown function, contains a J-domain [Komagataella phaffii GS115]CCA38155.1 Diphthamide biosynthesis protein 4 [Komagataella phaffii CBS 7435]